MEGSVAAVAPVRACLDRRMSELHRLVDSGDFDLLSLDVFDTFVYREAPRPTDVFFHVAALLREPGARWDSSSAESFVRERIQAEGRARGRKTGYEVTLAEIWAEFPRGYFRRGGPEEALRAELECERRVVRVMEPMRDLVQRAQARGMRIAFVSDTYFSRRHIHQFTGLEPDYVVLSCEHACSKAMGLHRVLLLKSNVPSERVLHVGDSHAADVDGPQRFGIARFWFRKFPGEFEGMTERELPEQLGRRVALAERPDGGLTSLRSHAMAECASPHERWGAGVLGPVLAGYADWLVARCAELGIDTVLCLMREGTTIRRTLEAAGAPLRAHEVYISRFVALKASIVHGTVAELARFVLRPTPVRAAKLLAQLGLTPADLPDLDPDHKLPTAEIRTLVHRIADDALLRNKVLASSAAARAGLLAHLRPLLPEHGRVAIADLGYKGTIQMGLQEALNAERVHLVTHGLYLVTGGNVYETQSTGATVEGWLAENGQPNALAHTFMRSPEIFEQGLMADCGTTVGHAADGTPVLDAFHVPPAQREQIAAVQRGAAVFQRHWTAHRRAHGPVDDGTMHELCRAIVVRAIARPLPVELDLFGHWQHDENFGSENVRTFTSVDGLHDWERSHASAHQLASLPSARVYWPFGLAWQASDVLGEAVAAIFLRSVKPEAFDAATGPRPMVVSWDDGSGWSDDHSAMVEFTPASHGRCWQRSGIAVRDAALRAVALGFGATGDLIALTGARVHWRSEDGEEEAQTFAADALLVHGAETLAPGLHRVTDASAVVLLELPLREGFRGVADIDLFFGLLPGGPA